MNASFLCLALAIATATPAPQQQPAHYGTLIYNNRWPGSQGKHVVYSYSPDIIFRGQTPTYDELPDSGNSGSGFDTSPNEFGSGGTTGGATGGATDGNTNGVYQPPPIGQDPFLGGVNGYRMHSLGRAIRTVQVPGRLLMGRMDHNLTAWAGGNGTTLDISSGRM